MCKNFIFIGDSLTFGYGVPKSKSWVGLVSNEIKLENKGVNGDTTTGILTRFYRDVTSKNPKNVFIMCGTNDLLMGRSVSSILENIELMIKDLNKSNIIIGIPPIIIKDMAEELFSYSNYYSYCETNLPMLRDGILNFKKKYSIEIIDFYSLTKSINSSEIFLDGIHLNKEGNYIMFKESIYILHKFI